MMINKALFSLFIILISLSHGAGQVFISGGNITYERKIQMHKILEANTWFKGNLDNVPKFYISQFELRFNPDTMIYSKSGEDEPNSSSWAVYAKDNEIVSLLNSHQAIMKKNVWNDSYLIKDTLRSYKWKLVNETRKIAGIECKKATTILNDSMYIIAFYAENIAVSGGPEQFNGLPGMILGVVIPRLHVSYYAQKVVVNEKQNLTLPKQRIKSSMSRKEFQEMIIKSLKWEFSNASLGVLYLFI